MSKGRLFVISGPSGAGKTTLLKRLINKYKEEVCFSVSHTSRNPRKGEIHGKDYYFISKEEFENLINSNVFLEYAVVHDNYYGTSRNIVDNVTCKGRDCILDIDVQGGLNLMNRKIQACYIFISPPDIDSLKKRLLKRSTDSIEVIEKRVTTAEKEMMHKDKYDYIVINDNLDNAFRILEKIYLKEKI